MTAPEPLANLPTEQRNPRTADLDALSALALVEALHTENETVFAAVQSALPAVAQLVDIVTERWAQGGRLFYVGAGTSGRLGVLDASECPPTFGVPATLVQGVIAGGEIALTSSVENAEDDPQAGANDLLARELSPLDVVVGIAASGRTPYVIGALDAARSIGSVTAAVVNVPDSELSRHADITIAAVTGPEALTGSTRLKAGTAQKIILNLITTAAMTRSGRVYENLMVDVRATNDKLRDRVVRIVMEAAAAPRPAAEAALAAADGSAKTALVMLLANLSAEEALSRLDRANGNVRKALVVTP